MVATSNVRVRAGLGATANSTAPASSLFTDVASVPARSELYSTTDSARALRTEDDVTLRAIPIRSKSSVEVFSVFLQEPRLMTG